jgi:hypothetical protein
MPLVRPNLSYDRSAIMRSAWDDYRAPLNRYAGGGFRRSFGACLSYAWRVARNVRARMTDGSLAGEKAEYEARQRAYAEAAASETPEAGRPCMGLHRAPVLDGRPPS